MKKTVFGQKTLKTYNLQDLSREQAQDKGLLLYWQEFQDRQRKKQWKRALKELAKN